MEKIIYEITNFSDVSCMEDFYKKIGLLEDLRTGEISSVCHIFMEQGNCEKLLEYIKKNWDKNTDSYFYKDKKKENSYLSDWINFSPTSKKFMSKNEIEFFYDDEFCL